MDRDGRNFSSTAGVMQRGQLAKFDVAGLARWWHAATSEARTEILHRAWHKDPTAPSLDAIRIAWYLAEVEAGEVSEG